MADALGKGLAFQERRLREIEADSGRTPGARFKHADDAAAVLMAPGAETGVR